LAQHHVVSDALRGWRPDDAVYGALMVPNFIILLYNRGRKDFP